MNNVLKETAEVTLLSLITKKTIQPLWTQLWTFAQMVFNCWLAVAAALGPHVGNCEVAFEIAVVICVKAIGTSKASCMPLDMMSTSKPGRPRILAILKIFKLLMIFVACWASCWSCAAWLLMFSTLAYAENKLLINGVAQFWTFVPVEITLKLYTVMDMKQYRYTLRFPPTPYQQSEYKVIYELMCWLSGSLTCRLPNVMRSPPARRSLVSSITVDWFLAPRRWGFYLKSNLLNSQTMVTTGILPPTRKIPMVEPGIEPGTSWSVVRSSEH